MPRREQPRRRVRLEVLHHLLAEREVLLDGLLFAGEGGALSKDVTLWLVWPLYFAGQALIAWGVLSTLSRERDRA